MTGTVFISYSRRDQEYVSRLAAHLAARGIRTSYDQLIGPGRLWSDVLEDWIENCTAMIVVVSPAAEKSHWVKREIKHAEDCGKPIIPLLLEGSLIFVIKHLQHQDVTNRLMPSDDLLDELRMLTEAAQQCGAHSPPAVSGDVEEGPADGRPADQPPDQDADAGSRTTPAAEPAIRRPSVFRTSCRLPLDRVLLRDLGSSTTVRVAAAGSVAVLVLAASWISTRGDEDPPRPASAVSPPTPAGTSPSTATRSSAAAPTTPTAEWTYTPVRDGGGTGRLAQVNHKYVLIIHSDYIEIVDKRTGVSRLVHDTHTATLDGDQVYVQSGAVYPSYIASIRIRDKRELWKTPVDDYFLRLNVVGNRLIAASDEVGAGLADGALVLDKTSGSITSRIGGEDSGARLIATKEDYALVGFAATKNARFETVAAFDVRTNKEKWRFPAEPSPHGVRVAAVLGSRVFGWLRTGDGLRNADAVCLDLRTGAVMWRRGLDWRGEDDGDMAGGFATDGKVAVYGLARHLEALDAASGSAVWRLNDVNGNSIAIDGAVAVTGAGNDIVGASLHDGTVAWRTRVQEGYPSPLLIAGVRPEANHIYAVADTSDGNTWFALSPDGALLWSGTWSGSVRERTWATDADSLYVLDLDGTVRRIDD